MAGKMCEFWKRVSSLRRVVCGCTHARAANRHALGHHERRERALRHAGKVADHGEDDDGLTRRERAQVGEDAAVADADRDRGDEEAAGYARERAAQRRQRLERAVEDKVDVRAKVAARRRVQDLVREFGAGAVHAALRERAEDDDNEAHQCSEGQVPLGHELRVRLAELVALDDEAAERAAQQAHEDADDGHGAPLGGDVRLVALAKVRLVSHDAGRHEAADGEHRHDGDALAKVLKLARDLLDRKHEAGQRRAEDAAEGRRGASHDCTLLVEERQVGDLLEGRADAGTDLHDRALGADRRSAQDRQHAHEELGHGQPERDVTLVQAAVPQVVPDRLGHALGLGAAEAVREQHLWDAAALDADEELVGDEDDDRQGHRQDDKHHVGLRGHKVHRCRVGQDDHLLHRERDQRDGRARREEDGELEHVDPGEVLDRVQPRHA
eukprot:Unigene3568_Nuclearia_a/m.10898 Unigene3568_Nuclearia_a/g.10898  ORF Unigene3568_Nuclearia_a/g.10898 Unigene3568_Nuclearia_a/m.10898 type:complete len:440 (+) Unigene3568_Nuclearia_a:178-1497(+)